MRGDPRELLPQGGSKTLPQSSPFVCTLQLGVFRLGLLQHGDIGVGVLPERQEILVGLPSALTLSPDKAYARPDLQM